MMKLSWDLHLHPGPSPVPRWGDGLRIWEAARAAGLQGFVWKSHDEHTVARCRALPPGPPVAIPSATLNPWTTLDEVKAAVGSGARWIWGPSRDAHGRLAWNLPLPPWWPALREWLPHTYQPVVLATAHLGPQGRREFARAAASMENVVCSVTHSAYVATEEAAKLAALGCAFEFDLYTYRFPQEGRPNADLLQRAASLREGGALVYLASDAGQQHVGNPFDFSAAVLAELVERAGRELIESLAEYNPAAFVRRVLPLEVVP